MNTEALIDRIRKLRAKAKDPSTTEAEASAFAAKVAELLQAHGLSEAALHQDAPEEVVSETWHGDYMTDQWRRVICNAAAKLYFCASYSTETGRGGKSARAHVFVGKPHNIVVAREMSQYLIDTTLRLGKQWRRAQDATHAEFVHFLRACGYRIAERLVHLHREQTSSAPQRSASGNPSNLPALYEDENALIAEFLKPLGLRNMSSRQYAEGHGAAAGRRAGDGVSLQAQVHGTSARLLS